MSSITARTLTSCFLDIILIPLCTWLYLFALLILSVVSFMHNRRKRTRSNNIPPAGQTEAKAAQSLRQEYIARKRKLHITGLVLYYFLLTAVTALTALEIARLKKADLGIGLLPFTFVTLLFAALLRLSKGIKNHVIGWRWLNCFGFSLLAIMHIVKIAEEEKGKAVWDAVKTNGPHGRGKKGSEYTVEDEVAADVSAMVACYVILAVLEAVMR